MLKRFVINNYRSCLHTSFDLHPNLSVLIGPNGSGKTNTLQAIMFLNRMTEQERFSRLAKKTPASTRVKATFGYRETQAELSATAATSSLDPSSEVIFNWQKWKLTNAKDQKSTFEAPLALVGEILSREMMLNRFYHVSSSHFRISRLHIERQIPSWAGSTLSKVFEYCKGIKYYSASQFTNPGNCPVSFQIEEEEGTRRRYGLSRFRGHERVLYSMYSAQKSDSSGKYEQFIDIVGPRGLKLIDDLKFKEYRTSSIDYSVRVGGKLERRKRNRLIVIPQFKIGKQRLSPNQLSEGTFKTLALLFHVITDEGSALLIEEPEVCVHHGLLSSILELVKSFSDKKQMILTTHSDFVLDHVKPENVYRVTFEPHSGTAVRHISKAMTAKEYSALREYLAQAGNLGEYWREGGLGDRP
jgi:ABC-type lipoprotein export system ATPase subunit